MIPFIAPIVREGESDELRVDDCPKWSGTIDLRHFEGFVVGRGQIDSGFPRVQYGDQAIRIEISFSGPPFKEFDELRDEFAEQSGIICGGVDTTQGVWENGHLREVIVFLGGVQVWRG